MVMHHFVDDEEHDRGQEPHTVQRHCTDIPCCLVFLAALGAFAYVCAFALQYGDPKRFFHLPNSQGKLCGTSEGLEDQKFLYFCKGASGLSPNNTICVDACPNLDDNPENSPMANLLVSCPWDVVKVYESRPLGGILCVPSNPVDALELEEALNNPMVRRVLELKEVFRNWKTLAIVALSAVVLGFIFCLFLEHCAFCIFWGSIFSMILVVGSLGGKLLYETLVYETPQGLEALEQLPELTTGDPQQDLLVGSGLCALAFALLCAACCFAGVVNSALEALKEAADCITDVPSLMLQPFIDLALKTALVVTLASGFWYLVSTANMSRTEDAFGQYELKYPNKEYAFVAYYLFMAYWILEITNAISSFAISYAVQLWYSYTRGGQESALEAPCFPTLQGLCAAVTFHLGTFAEGSFIIAIFRGLRDFMFLVTKQVSSTGNATTACCCCCCTCCLSFFNDFLRFMSKNAYMDTALNSNAFCKAAHHAANVLLTHAGEVAALNTATIIFQISGICGIAATGAGIAYLLCEYWDELSNPDSPTHVENKVALCGVAAAVAAFMATPFMVLLDHVSDTLLFCHCIKKKRTPPPPLYDEGEYEEGGCCCCGSTPPPRATKPERRALLPYRG